jgi:hypothetical protein
MMRLVLLAGDLVIVAVEIVVVTHGPSINDVAPQEVPHGVATLRSVSGTDPPHAVAIPLVEAERRMMFLGPLI